MQLVFASHNKNKIKEISELIPSTINLLGLSDINCYEEIAETADTIEGNAILKAKFVFENYKLNCFADDSGLEVEALNGVPGVYSARYAGEPKNDENNIKKLLLNLEQIKNRRAQFKTIISLIIDGIEQQFEGVIKGTIISEKKGTNGFGYDPIFVPEGYTKTFAEMDSETKNKISHRAIAVKKLLEFLNK